MSDVGTMEEQARKRRERLMAMRKRAADKDGDTNEAKHPKEEEKTGLKLRNYVPLDKNLVLNEPDQVKPVHVETEVSEQLDKAKPTLTVKDEVDLLNLAPRKIDWDLKRDIKGKLDKLERRTQRAIAELIRDRLKESPNSIGPQLAEVLSTPQS